MAELAAGAEVGGYRLKEKIGQGGMGVVWLAEHQESGRKGALKTLGDEFIGDESFRERFEREARYAEQLDHPNIVEVFEAGEDSGVLYMVMEYVEGQDLKELINEEGALPPRKAVELVGAVAQALDAAHEKGLLHRDVKPGNVMISADGTPFLMDFGLSKNPGQDSFALTAAGQFVGTIDYTAPEQILAKQIDNRADVYSLGCVLFECLTGSPPYERARDLEVLYAHIQDPVPSAREKRPEVPAALDAVIEKALAKEPGDRYATCSELVAAAREALDMGDEEEELGANVLLRVTEGNATGLEILVDDEFVIGRQQPGDGKLGADPEISRRHATVRRDGTRYMIEDHGSTNGTFVNGMRISDPVILRSGDRVAVGDTVLLVQSPEDGLGALPPSPESQVAPVPVPPKPPSTPSSATLEDEIVDVEQAPAKEDRPTGERPSKVELSGQRVIMRVEIDLEKGLVLIEPEGSSKGVRVSTHADGWRIEPTA